ncbi:hypothetical protein Syun_027057 [Stephania yunnanensis]|uniref:Uncharacterized protein n=1 Tax=Stephania yunnanensis TaxID=152371 RepID=A0AAP0HPU4_9MAGN
MNTLADEASTSNGSSSRPHLFYTKVVNFNSFQKIYGLVQCTPDITPGECGVCLRSGIRWIPTMCDGTSGGKQLQPSCYLQYDVYPFYQLKENLSPVSPSPQSTKPNPSPISPSPKHPEPSCHPKNQDVEVNITTAESLQFDFENVRAATDDFSIANKLGEGGFGPVYKGRLSDGRSVAVKRLSRDSVQGDEEFKNEVMLVAKLQHRNLVRLLGFCFEGQERLLIYEFVPNASLDRFIFGLLIFLTK